MIDVRDDGDVYNLWHIENRGQKLSSDNAISLRYLTHPSVSAVVIRSFSEGWTKAGRPRRARTLTNGFGDRYATITLWAYLA